MQDTQTDLRTFVWLKGEHVTINIAFVWHLNWLFLQYTNSFYIYQINCPNPRQTVSYVLCSQDNFLIRNSNWTKVNEKKWKEYHSQMISPSTILQKKQKTLKYDSYCHVILIYNPFVGRAIEYYRLPPIKRVRPYFKLS